MIPGWISMIKLLLLLYFISSMGIVSAKEGIEFSATDLSGNVHHIEQYRGKWVVVNYWGSFCGPCIKEMPELSIFHNEHKDDDAIVLGINQEDIPAKLLANFTKNLNVNFPSLKVPFEEVTPFGSVTVLPSTFIINPQGKLVARQAGVITVQMLEDYIESKKLQAKQENI